MNSELIIIESTSIWVEVTYHIVSLLFFAFLFYGRIKIDVKRSYVFAAIYIVIVLFFIAIQMIIFRIGNSFVNGFLSLSINVDDYSSIHYGGFFYAVLYSFSFPSNVHGK